MCTPWTLPALVNKKNVKPFMHVTRPLNLYHTLPNLKDLPEEDLRKNCVNPFPNKPWFLRVCSASLLKTLWEKEKLLVKSNLSFSHSVFYPFVELFAILIKSEIVVCKLSLWKSLKFVVWERVNQHFLHIPQYFLPLTGIVVICVTLISSVGKYNDSVQVWTENGSSHFQFSSSLSKTWF